MGKKNVSTTPAGLAPPRITRCMRGQVGHGRIARAARDGMLRHEQQLCNYLLDKCVAQMKPLADGAGSRRIKNKHIDAALRADPELAALLGVSARLLKTRRAVAHKKAARAVHPESAAKPGRPKK